MKINPKQGCIKSGADFFLLCDASLPSPSEKGFQLRQDSGCPGETSGHLADREKDAERDSFRHKLEPRLSAG